MLYAKFGFPDNSNEEEHHTLPDNVQVAQEKIAVKIQNPLPQKKKTALAIKAFLKLKLSEK